VKVLYITYYGLLKHLCQTQVIPYLEGLAADGHEIFVLSFEEGSAQAEQDRRQSAVIRERLALSGIQWHPLRYHKRPSLPATAYDVIAGSLYASYLVRKHKIDAVHCRNHIPALMGLVLKRLFGTRLIFDLRGVMAEEYVDAGSWREGGIPFRLTKWVEEKSLSSADAIVMLTNKIRDVLRERSPGLAKSSAEIEIIPCCVDTQEYAAADGVSVRKELGLSGKFILVYAGSLGGWYMAEEMVELFSELAQLVPDAHFLILTQSRYELITASFEQQGISPNRYTILTVSPAEMPGYLAAGDLAVSFIKPCFSKLSSSPTKIGEYLASGLPIVTNRGIGDVDELMLKKRVGVLVDSFDGQAYRKALAESFSWLSNGKDVRGHCRQVAKEEFSLELIGKRRYCQVYDRVAGQPGSIAEADGVAVGGDVR